MIQSESPMHVVIMAGGLGTRISGVRSDVPKPMIDVCGKPVLHHTLEMLHRQGHDDVTLVVGHLGHVIREAFGDGSSLGVRISYYLEEEPLGTAGALVAMRDVLTDDFLLLNGDIVMDVDVARIEKYHRDHGALATLATHPNSHPYDSAILEADREGRITNWYTKEDSHPPCRNLVNAGVHVLSPRALDGFAEVQKLDLDRDVLRPLLATGRVYSYRTTEYIKDMGTPVRYRQVCREVAMGIPQQKNLLHRQKAVFLDRDGTINRYVGYVTCSEQVELVPGAASAIRSINNSGFLAIVVTNQPVIARGDCGWDDLDAVHATLEEQLGREGAYLDDIYVCPHHPDKGFPGEVAAYKHECSCRKPKPGMLIEASKRYNIDLQSSWMVGDGWRDVAAGEAVGCRTYLLEAGSNLATFCQEHVDGSI